MKLQKISSVTEGFLVYSRKNLKMKCSSELRNPKNDYSHQLDGIKYEILVLVENWLILNAHFDLI